MLKERVIKAYEYAQKKHEGQIRKFTDLPYFTHPKGVARTLEQLTGFGLSGSKIRILEKENKV